MRGLAILAERTQPAEGSRIEILAERTQTSMAAWPRVAPSWSCPGMRQRRITLSPTRAGRTSRRSSAGRNGTIHSHRPLDWAGLARSGPAPDGRPGVRRTRRHQRGQAPERRRIPPAEGGTTEAACSAGAGACEVDFILPISSRQTMASRATCLSFKSMLSRIS